MPPLQLGVGRGGAEVGFLDASAGDADKMVMVVGAAADIRGSARSGERVVRIDTPSSRVT